MLETFLVLLAGGIMLAVVVCDPRDVTLNWLRLCGILALVFSGLGLFLLMWNDTRVDAGWRPTYRALLIVTIVIVLAQLAFVQIAWRKTQRIAAILAFCAAIATAVMFWRGTGLPAIVATIAFAGVAGVCGIALMDMLLGHAYLTASRMTMSPFRRLNLALMIVLGLRVLSNVIALAMQQARPIEMFWSRNVILLGTRWLVGFAVAAVFVYMAHDCIKRRATQSATGILYVAGVMIFLGEIIALQLVRETGLPF